MDFTWYKKDLVIYYKDFVIYYKLIYKTYIIIIIEVNIYLFLSSKHANLLILIYAIFEKLESLSTIFKNFNEQNSNGA